MENVHDCKGRVKSKFVFFKSSNTYSNGVETTMIFPAVKRMGFRGFPSHISSSKSRQFYRNKTPMQKWEKPEKTFNKKSKIYKQHLKDFQ